MGPDRGRTGDARAQTTQDFALGVGLFILAVGFAFAFIPAAFLFTGADPGPTEVKQAERTSTGLIQNLSVGERQNTLEPQATADYFNQVATESELQDAYELPNGTRINVTIRALDDDAVIAIRNSSGVKTALSSGTDYPTDRPAAEVVRIVRIVDDEGDCDPACQLVVRVW